MESAWKKERTNDRINRQHRPITIQLKEKQTKINRVDCGEILSMPSYFASLSPLSSEWYVACNFLLDLLCVYGECVCVVGALVWQLANLIHAINYVVSLTHGTQAFRAWAHQSGIKEWEDEKRERERRVSNIAKDIYLPHVNMIFSNIVCAKFLIFFVCTHKHTPPAYVCIRIYIFR